MILVNEVLVGGQLRLKHRCVIESRSVECRVIKVDVNTADFLFPTQYYVIWGLGPKNAIFVSRD